jgi:endonuclease YncB( thermonuclease family)
MLRLAALALVLLADPVAAQERARIVDGDTIRVAGQSVRVMGLDAPEMRRRYPREMPLARAAAVRLDQLVAGVWLEQLGCDRYGRQLAVVRDGRARNVAEIPIGEGLALRWTRAPGRLVLKTTSRGRARAPNLRHVGRSAADAAPMMSVRPRGR